MNRSEFRGQKIPTPYQLASGKIRGMYEKDQALRMATCMAGLPFPSLKDVITLHNRFSLCNKLKIPKVNLNEGILGLYVLTVTSKR